VNDRGQLALIVGRPLRGALAAAAVLLAAGLVADTAGFAREAGALLRVGLALLVFLPAGIGAVLLARAVRARDLASSVCLLAVAVLLMASLFWRAD
jgi:hypothetical protein